MERLNFERLKIKQQKVESAIDNLKVAKECIGTSAIPRYQVLESGTCGEVDVVLSKLRVAEIRKKITEESIPTLESIRREVEREIGRSLGIDRLRLSIPKMKALAAGGYLPQTDLDEARELLARLEETVKTPLVKEAGVPTPPMMEADLKQKRYSQAHASFEVEVFDRTLLVNGKLQAEALKAVKGTSEEKSIGSDELATILYGENNQRTRDCASLTLIRLNKVLSSQGAEVVLMVKPQERARGAHAKYFLRRITEEGEKRGVAQAETEKLSKIVIDLERNIVIVDGEEKTLTGKISKAVLLFMASRAQKPAPNKSIGRVAVRAGSKTRAPAGNAIAGLRKLLEADPKDPKILVSIGPKGRNTKYLLKADVVIIEKSPAEGSAKPLPVEAKPEADADIVTSGPLTDQEAAILAIALSVNGALIKDFGFEPLPPEVASSLWKKVQGSFSVDRGHLREERLAVLEKVRTLIETDEVYKLVDLYTKETEALLSFLTQANASRLLGFIRELIESPEDAGWSTEMIRRGGHYYGNGKSNLGGTDPGAKPPDAEKTQEPKAVPTIQKTARAKARLAPDAMSVEEVEKLEAAISALVDEEEAQVPASVVEPKEPEEASEESKTAKKPKPLSIEKRDAHVRETISQIMDEIESNGIKKPLNANQLANHYPSLKMSFLKLVREKRYIKPEKGRDGNHPAYAIKDIAMLVYAYGQHNGFSTREIRDLRRLIEDEIARRKQSR